MFDTFYNKSIRYLTVAFGSLFNNIYVQRLDGDGNETERIRVPLGYGPKQKYIRRYALDIDSGLETPDTQVTLPRISFEMTGAAYDPTRKRNTLQKRYRVGASNDTTYHNYVEVPYDFSFSLSVLTKYMEDGLQITEQILPYFTPEFNITININEVNQKIDIPIVLDSYSITEDYEGDFDARRLISFDMEFTAKSYVFGPEKSSDIIQTVSTTFYDTEEFALSGRITGVSGATQSLSRISVGVSGPSGASSGVDNFTAFTVETLVLGASGGLTL